MSTSDKIKDIKITLVYLGITVLCAVVAAVYTSFSHGETSPFMTFIFAFPLTAGAVVCTARRFGLKDRFFVNAFNASAATFGAWSCIRGVFDMARGASSRFMPVFLVVGAGFFLAAVIRCMVLAFRK